MREARSSIIKPIGLAIFWLGAFVVGAFVTINYWPDLSTPQLTTLLIYLAIIVVLESFPLVLGSTNINFSFAISFMAFLKYGLVVEMILVQLAVVISFLFFVRVRKLDAFFYNSGMMLYMSVAAAIVYNATGGKIGFTVLELEDMILPILLYGATYFIVNHFLIYISMYFRTNQRDNNFLQAALWDGLIFVFSLSFGVLMYVSNKTFGPFALFLFAVLYLVTILIVRFYASYRLLNVRIKAVNRLVSSFASELDLRRLIEAIKAALPDLNDYDYSNIYLINANQMTPIRNGDNGNGNSDGDEDEDSDWLDYDCEGICNPDKRENCLVRKEIFSQVLESKEPLLVNDAKKLAGGVRLGCPEEVRSMLSVPMVWNNQLIGLINFASRKTRAFSKNDVNMLSLFASQAALAITNAINYKVVEERSLIDELTALYNYRGFNDILEEKLLEGQANNWSVALLMIDIDFFKHINDTYGHPAGNQVLRTLADILKSHTRSDDIVSRYGGEEFTIIIPRATEELAYDIAERLRKTVEKHWFMLTDTFDGEVKKVQLTISIGLSLYPQQAETVSDLLRYSDRALYFGAKMQGRNKVAVHGEQGLSE